MNLHSRMEGLHGNSVPVRYAEHYLSIAANRLGSASCWRMARDKLAQTLWSSFKLLYYKDKECGWHTLQLISVNTIVSQILHANPVRFPSRFSCLSDCCIMHLQNRRHTSLRAKIVLANMLNMISVVCQLLQLLECITFDDQILECVLKLNR